MHRQFAGPETSKGIAFELKVITKLAATWLISIPTARGAEGVWFSAVVAACGYPNFDCSEARHTSPNSVPSLGAWFYPPLGDLSHGLLKPGSPTRPRIATPTCSAGLG